MPLYTNTVTTDRCFPQYQPIYWVARKLFLFKIPPRLQSRYQHGKSYVSPADPQTHTIFGVILYGLQGVQLQPLNHRKGRQISVNPVSELLDFLTPPMISEGPRINSHICNGQFSGIQHNHGLSLPNKGFYGGRTCIYRHNIHICSIFTCYQQVSNKWCKSPDSRHRVISSNTDNQPKPQQLTPTPTTPPLIPLAQRISLHNMIDLTPIQMNYSWSEIRNEYHMVNTKENSSR